MDKLFDDKTPIYLQIMNMLKRDIVTEKLKGGNKLPSVRELSVELKVNPNTIQRAYQEIEREGIVYTQRGMGTFVKEDNEMVKSLKKEMAKDIISNFIIGMNSLGFTKEEILKIISEKIEEGEV